MEPRSLMGEISDMYIGTTTVLIPVSLNKLVSVYKLNKYQHVSTIARRT